MSPDQTPREQLAAGIETWVNRDWFVLPGPVDMSGELVEHLAKHLAGWRPPARVITDPAELDALPSRSIVVDDAGYCAQRSVSTWHRPLAGVVLTSAQVLRGGRVTVLHTPENGDTP